jgi:hypothetical protein
MEKLTSLALNALLVVQIVPQQTPVTVVTAQITSLWVENVYVKVLSTLILCFRFV